MADQCLFFCPNPKTKTKNQNEIPDLFCHRGPGDSPRDPPSPGTKHPVFSDVNFRIVFYDILTTFWSRKVPKVNLKTIQNGSKNRSQNEAKTNMGNNKKSWTYHKNARCTKNKKACSRASTVYIYTNQLVSKWFSNKSKQIIPKWSKKHFRKHQNNDANKYRKSYPKTRCFRLWFPCWSHLHGTSVR